VLALRPGSIMTGQNRFLLSDRHQRSGTAGSTCVFISYRRHDELKARVIASALMSNNVDVWIDLRSEEVGRARMLDDEHALASAIEQGLAQCSHLLGLLSSNTFSSPWVPYEIGSARGRLKPVAHVIDHSVQDSQIPAFVRLGTPITDQASLQEWLRPIRRILLDSRHAAAMPASVSTILPEIRPVRL